MAVLPPLAPHPFEPAKRANPNGPGLIDEAYCGFHQATDDQTGQFCMHLAGSPVHTTLLEAAAEDAAWRAKPSTCRACPDGCPSCTRNRSDCECYEHDEPEEEAR
ncbi:hypothetical protein [Catenuloplanes indicus]|uniref:Uncharacterized protein n=1 Tax=Catenuloplanes indicus TaxID=137267 RepID=A0AAE3WAM1_9ACTN|nr:hypothetical protein [Catenuloplanes indicus]MDQ0371572.1 hypothetical protein [Catenuloplanes indicus]